MRVVPFVYCVVLTVVLAGLYISRHNHFTELRIRALSLEKELRSEEAEQRRLELQIALFTSPVRLEEIARKAQYAHLRQPSTDELLEF
jgi:cell division protein FtsL